MGDRLISRMSARTALVLDNDLLTPNLGEPIAKDARDGVCPAARRQANHNAYDASWPGLRYCRRRGYG